MLQNMELNCTCKPVIAWDGYAIGTIVFCPLHSAAMDLLAASRKAYLALQVGHNDYTDYGLKSAIDKTEAK